MQDTIVNQGGELRSATGPKAVEAFRLRTIIVMLRSELKGLRFKVSALKAAKAVDGLKTNDRSKHIVALTVLLERTLADVTIVTDGVTQP